MDARAIFTAALATALLALPPAPARAQAQDVDNKVVVDPDSLPSAKALDRRFHDVLNRMPDAKENSDPWGSVRAAESTSKPKPKDDKKHPATTAVK